MGVGEGGLLISCARATRGLRRPSLNARSGRSSRAPSREKSISELGGNIIVVVRRAQLRTHEPASIYNGAAHTNAERHYSMG